MCNERDASGFAAAVLRDLGHPRAIDLAGGDLAVREASAGDPGAGPA